MSFFYIWPAFAALIYAVAAIFTKRALAEGAGVVRFTFLCNAAFFLLFLIPATIAGEPLQWNQMGWPVLGGCLFFLGQILTVLAIRLGDVSVQSPLMGSKVVFVALISAVSGAEAIQSGVWIGAALTAAAVFLLGLSDWRKGRRTWIAVGLALASAVAFAGSDVLTMAKATASGVENYLAMVMGVQLLLSLALIPLFSQPLRSVPKSAWRWLAAASALMAIQAALLNVALGYYRHATAFNVIYSSRGLWSVVLVWWFGRLVGNTELQSGRTVLARRMAGALLLLVAVGLVLGSG